MVYNVQPKHRNTLRGTYAGDQYDASGRQRVTPRLSAEPGDLLVTTFVHVQMLSRVNDFVSFMK